jgi:fructose-1,6-bisphosphatase/inositol monophosphatase family enzyme
MDILHFALGLRGALYQCGQVARALQGQVSAEDKTPDSVHQQSTAVSVVDRLCQEIILLRAHELAPEIEAYSEEWAACPPEILRLYAGHHHRYALILDPLDGTEDYLRGKSTYGHMAGLLDQEIGRMACGLIYFPATARLYLGVRGLGAFLAEGFWATPQRLCSAQPPRSVGHVKRLLSTDEERLAQAGFTLVPSASASAAYELVRVAEGHLGAAVMRQFHGHDTAITSVLIEELGGAALVEGGQIVRYEKDMPRMPLVVASISAEYAQALTHVLS